MPADLNDEPVLQSWNFIRDYRRKHKELTHLAKSIYAIVGFLSGPSPQPDDCVDLYEIALAGFAPYQGIIKRKRHLPPQLIPGMTRRMARYVIYDAWSSIKSP